MQIHSGEPRAVSSSSSTALELPTSSFCDTPELIVLLILSVVLLPSATEAIDADIVHGPVTGQHAIVVEILLKQFCAILKEIVSIFLLESSASEAVIAVLMGLADSI